MGLIKVSGTDPLYIQEFYEWTIDEDRFVLRGKILPYQTVKFSEGEFYTLRFNKQDNTGVIGSGFFNLKMKLLSLEENSEDITCIFQFNAEVDSPSEVEE